MLVWIWTRDDETGVLDGEFRDGDIDHVDDDAKEASLGTLEKKVYLIVKIPDPPNVSRVTDEASRSEYRPGPTAESPNVVRHKRIYRVDWRSKFSASEIETILDAAEMLPDGATSGGGSVTSGVVSGLFTFADFVRK